MPVIVDPVLILSQNFESRIMRTFYFDMKDGAIVRDTVGLRFPSTAAAIEHGIQLAQKLRGDDPRGDDPNLFVRVIDQSGAEVHREQVYQKKNSSRECS